MIFDYKPLWKMLIDRNMTRSELRVSAGISTRALAKMGKNEDVSTDVLKKICTVLNCNLSEIMETRADPSQQMREGVPNSVEIERRQRREGLIYLS